MKKDTIYVTKDGLEELKRELAGLVDMKRPEVAKRIRNAREMGDISENAEYDAAKQEQSYIEGRIAELEDIIKEAKIAPSTVKDEVVVGARVRYPVGLDPDTS